MTFDDKTRPQDDFYGHINNKWIENNPIPPEHRAWGTFSELDNASTEAVKQIIDDILSRPIPSLSNKQKLIKKFCETSMSYNSHKKNNLMTLSNEIKKITDITNLDQLAFYLGHAHATSSRPFWSYYIDVDNKNSNIQAIYFSQNGLILPNRDFYIENTKRMKEIREKYKCFFEKILKQMPNHSATNWDSIINIENQLADKSWSEIELRNIEKNYNKFTLAKLEKRFPDFNWQKYFEGLGWENPNDNIIVGQPTYFEEALKIINNYSLNDIKEYLKWHLVSCLSKWIDESTNKIRFEFYGKVLQGTTEDLPLWKRTIHLGSSTIIGELFGEEYVTRFFPESSKQSVVLLVELIKDAYHKRIDEVTWMEDKTKDIAHKKLNKMRVFVGYPSYWHKHDSLILCEDNQLLNILSLNKYETQLDLDKIGNSPEPEDWHMNAYEANAYNDLNQLVVCFPAAILNPPFFDPNADIATNLGGAGYLIGHELSHSFDDQGSQFDEYGNTNSWQSQKEKKDFKNLSKGLVVQANKYEVLPGIFQKGKLVIGEVIADLGGIELALGAIKIANKNNVSIDMLQKFFINYAKCERMSMRDEYQHQIAKIDVHPPAKFRTNGTLSNVDDFYVAFDVKPGDKMYLPPEDRVRIW